MKSFFGGIKVNALYLYAIVGLFTISVGFFGENPVFAADYSKYNPSTYAACESTIKSYASGVTSSTPTVTGGGAASTDPAARSSSVKSKDVTDCNNYITKFSKENSNYHASLTKTDTIEKVLNKVTLSVCKAKGTDLSNLILAESKLGSSGKVTAKCNELQKKDDEATAAAKKSSVTYEQCTSSTSGLGPLTSSGYVNTPECQKIVSERRKQDNDNAKKKKDETEGGGEETKEDQKSCNIDKVGWIVCPTLTTTAEFVSGIYQYIAKNFLEIQSGTIFGGGNPNSESQKSIYDVWVSFRDISNVLFVIMFMTVIISQTTNIGISNYGIKKMLPRLIIFAVLINVSYWISVIAVDMSNIIGKGIYNLIIGIAGSSAESSWKMASKSGGDGNESLLSTIVATLLTTTTAVIAAGGIGAALAAVIIALIVMVSVLTIRQAVVIILVIVSPIAFAAAILPQTEDIFKKWKNLLKGMLITYPVASMLMAGCILASNVLSDASEGDDLKKALFGLLPMIGLVGVISVVRGAIAVVDKLTNGSISKGLGRVEGAVNKAGGMVDKRIGQTRGIQAVKNNPISRRFARSNASLEARNTRNREMAELKDYRKKGYANLNSDQQRHMASLESKFSKDSMAEIDNAAAVKMRDYGFDSDKYAQDLDTEFSSAVSSGNGAALAASIQAVMSSNLSGGKKAEILKGMMQGATKEQLESAGVKQAMQLAQGSINKLREKDLVTAQTMTEAAGGNARTRQEVASDEKTYTGASASLMSTQTGGVIGEMRQNMDNFSDAAKQDIHNKSSIIAAEGSNIGGNTSELGQFHEIKNSTAPSVAAPTSTTASNSSSSATGGDVLTVDHSSSSGAGENIKVGVSYGDNVKVGVSYRNDWEGHTPSAPAGSSQSVQTTQARPTAAQPQQSSPQQQAARRFGGGSSRPGYGGGYRSGYGSNKK